MNKILRKMGFLTVILLFTSITFAEMHGEMRGEMMEEKEAKENHQPGMSPCSMGNDMMMEKMHKMQGDGKECMSCMKIKMILKNSKMLELTEDQINKIRALNTECVKNNIKKGAEIDLLKIDKKEMMTKEEVDLDGLKKILNKIHELKSDKELSCIETSIKVKKLLNDKQNEKMKEMKHKMM